MPLSYTEMADMSQDIAFIRRVKYAMVKAAIAVFPDANEQRNALAAAVLDNPDRQLKRFTDAVLTQLTGKDPSDITDNKLDTAVSAVWNDLAGVTA